MSEKLIYEAFGRAIAVHRKGLRLTQEKLARRVGMSRASIANIESGRQNVLLHQLYRFADALELQSAAVLLPAAPKPAVEDHHMPIAEAKVPQDKLSPQQRALVGELVAAAMATRTPKAGV